MRRSLHLQYGYTPENPVLNTQKLSDTEDPEENLQVITMRVVQRHPRRIVTLTKTYRWRYPHDL
jgi:hypothetical protein